MTAFNSPVPNARHFTDSDGNAARLRVDVGQTGFFDRREFRTFRRIAVASGGTRVVKVVVPVNIILHSLKVDMVDGWVDVETRVGGTEGGTYAESMPILPRNTMDEQPAYSPVVTALTGGTHTGGTVIDVIMARSAGATAQAFSVGSALSDERGIGAGTYYFVITNPGAGANNGTISAWWEERP